MKIINVSKTPYEFTFDGGNYGPFAPGEVVDYPNDIALHAIRKSAVMDDEGQVETYRMESLVKVQGNPEWLKSVATYPCPFSVSGQCDAQPFKDIESLKTHLDVHFLGKQPKK